MRRFRFSLMGLFVLVTLVAIGCTALAYASDLWARGLFTAMAIMLMVSVLVAVYRPGRARAFAVGFFVLGGGYFVLANMPKGRNSYSSTPAFAKELLTTKLLDLAYAEWLPKVRTPPAPVNPMGGAFGGYGGSGFGGGGGGAGGIGGVISGGGSVPGSIGGGGSGAAARGMPGVAPGMPLPGAGGAGQLGPGAAPAIHYPTHEDFMRVGQSLWTLAFAVLGGLLAGCLATGREAREPRGNKPTKEST